MNKKKRTLTLIQRREYAGLIFILPWLLGFVLFFSVPLFESLRFALNQLIITPEGYMLEFLGLENFKHAMLVHANYNRMLTEAAVDMLINVPMILFFSLFAAVVLNQAFKGRVIARAIFFLPVIIATGAISSAEVSNALNTMVMGISQKGGSFEAVGLLKSFELERMLYELNVSPAIIQYLVGAVNRIFEIVSNSGVQILIFLAGLQAVPRSMYEVARIEGATGYETFWKVTFPMVSSLILTNVIYTIIDSFADNELTELIMDTAFRQYNFGLSAAMAWLYTLVISILLIVVGYSVSKRVFYHN